MKEICGCISQSSAEKQNKFDMGVRSSDMGTDMEMVLTFLKIGLCNCGDLQVQNLRNS